MNTRMDDVVGEAMDRLVNVEMRFGAGLPRGIIHRLYDAARADQKRPLTTLAVDALMGALTAGDNVLIVTGAGAPPWLPVGETDGPLGAIAIGRALDIALGAKPIFVSEDRNLGPIRATAIAAGLPPMDAGTFAKRSACCLTENFVLDAVEGPRAARALIGKHKPKAVIFIEKGGPNAKGVFHTITGNGRDRTTMASADALAYAASEAGILTVGIGDGGNEIGFGRVTEAVKDIQNFGRVCACPCKDGIATIVPTDVLVVGAVSNWAGYAIAAGLALATGRHDALHDLETEREMLRQCYLAGAVDGITARQVPGVDGTSAETQTALITMLRMIVENASRELSRPF